MDDLDPLWRPAGALSELPEDEPIGLELPDADDRPVKIALVRRGAAVYAVHDRCPHRGAPFSELGLIDEDGTLLCGWHYWGFHLGSGRHTQVEGIRVCTFPTRVLDGAVEVDVARPPHRSPPLVTLE